MAGRVAPGHLRRASLPLYYIKAINRSNLIPGPNGHCHVAAFSLHASASGLRQHLRGRFGGEEGLAGMRKLGATRAAAAAPRELGTWVRQLGPWQRMGQFRRAAQRSASVLWNFFIRQTRATGKRCLLAPYLLRNDKIGLKLAGKVEAFQTFCGSSGKASELLRHRSRRKVCLLF